MSEDDALAFGTRDGSGSVDDSGVRSTAAGHRASSTAGRNAVVPARGSSGFAVLS
jgi:hypothetical protein